MSPRGISPAPGRLLPAHLALHGAVVLFGVAGLFGKWVAAPPHVIVLGRVVFASLTLAAVLRWRGRPLAPPAGDRLRLVVCGALLAVHWWAFFQAIQVSSVAVGVLAYATAPVFVVLAEPWGAGGERFSVHGLGAALLTVGGVALVVPQWQLADATARGVAWGLLAGATFAALALLNRGLSRRHGALPVALHQDAVAAVLLLPPVLLVPPPHVDAVLLGQLAVLGVLCTALAHGWFIVALARVPARVATVAGNMEPVYGIALAALLLGEEPAPRTLAGGALIITAVMWASCRAGSGR